MKTLLLLLLPFLCASQQYQAIQISFVGSIAGVPVLITDNVDDSVVVYTDSLGIAGGYIVNDYGDWMYGYFTDCSGAVQTVDVGGVDTLYGSAVYCVAETPMYELIINGNQFSLSPDVQGVHFTAFDQSGNKIPLNYKKWSSGLYIIKAWKGNDLLATFQINKTQ